MRKRLWPSNERPRRGARRYTPKFLKLVVTQEEECKFSLQEFGVFQVFAFPRRFFCDRVGARPFGVGGGAFLPRLYVARVAIFGDSCKPGFKIFSTFSRRVFCGMTKIAKMRRIKRCFSVKCGNSERELNNV